MSQFVETGCRYFAAGAARAQFLRVYLSGTTLTTAGASNAMIGTQERTSLASTDQVPVRLRNAQGTRKVVASDAITAGADVYAAASGKVAPTGTIIEGQALEAATADGDVIEIIEATATTVSSAATGTTSSTYEVDSDAATPKIALAGQTAGTGDFTTTLKPETALSADNSIIVPESNGDTLMALALAQTVSAIKTHSADTIYQDDVDLALGTSSDVLMRFSTGDASNHAAVIALDDTSQQIHITDKGAVATDWNRTAGTHPELAIHSNTTPATDYLAIGNHDGTTASVDVVGGTTFAIKVDGTTEASFTAAATTLPGMVTAVECVGNTAGVGITGTAASFVTSVEKFGTIIKTTILIDLAGLNSGGTADDIIGADGAGVAHLGQITAAVNGTIIGGRLTCLETPATGDNDIDLWYANESTGVEDTLITALTGEIQVTDGGDIAAGTVRAIIPIPADKYLYLVGHTGDADATYSTGVLLIELWGKAA